MAAQLKLNFYNVSFERISDFMRIQLDHTVLHKTYDIRKNVGKTGLRIIELDADQGGRYVLWVYPERYRSMFRIIRITDSVNNEEHIVLPVRPRSVKEVLFPTFEWLAPDLANVLARSNVESLPGLQGQQLFQALLQDPIKTAGLFNLHSKMDATVFRNGRSVFSYVDALTRVRGDRIFCQVQKDLRDEVVSSKSDEQFQEAGGALHTPPPGFALVDSFKTPELYGNLQLTFFCKINALEFLVDADIDDAGGLEHLFQVTEHKLAGTETHPYDIHQILLNYQQIDPGYQLIV
jgi:hypothetical protein